MELAEEGLSLPQSDPARPVSIIIGLYLVLILVGMGMLRPRGMISAANRANWNEVTFAAINAATLTGFERTLPPDNYASDEARAILAALTLAGVMLSLVAGGMLVTRVAKLPIGNGELIATSAVLVVLMTLVGAVGLGENRPLFDVLFLSLSAFGNSGLHAGPLPGVDSWRTTLILLPLGVIGGVGVPVILEIRNRLRGRQQRLSEFTWLVIRGTAGLYVLVTVLFVALWWLSMSPDQQKMDVRPTILSGSTAAINARGAGFNIEPVQHWPRAVQWAAMGLMAIGWNPGGTGGGLKITSLVAIVAMAAAMTRGRQPSRAGGFALAWLGIYGGIVFVALLLQLIIDPALSGERVLFETISAASNVGLSMHTVQGGTRDLVISATMLAGRLTPLLVLMWMWRRDERSLPIA